MLENDAIAKLATEVMHEEDSLIQMLEEHLTSICLNDHVAGKILQNGKTLKEIRDQLYAKAKPAALKNRKGDSGGCNISDAECFCLTEEYFGITEEDKAGIGNRKIRVRRYRS